MGMFDTVWARCPVCGTRNELQSKGGPRIMQEYQLHVAPADVLSDVDREFWCEGCDRHLEVVVPRPQAYVRVWEPEPDSERG